MSVFFPGLTLGSRKDPLLSALKYVPFIGAAALVLSIGSPAKAQQLPWKEPSNFETGDSGGGDCNHAQCEGGNEPTGNGGGGGGGVPSGVPQGGNGPTIPRGGGSVPGGVPSGPGADPNCRMRFETVCENGNNGDYECRTERRWICDGESEPTDPSVPGGGTGGGGSNGGGGSGDSGNGNDTSGTSTGTVNCEHNPRDCRTGHHCIANGFVWIPARQACVTQQEADAICEDPKYCDRQLDACEDYAWGELYDTCFNQKKSRTDDVCGIERSSDGTIGPAWGKSGRFDRTLPNQRDRRQRGPTFEFGALCDIVPRDPPPWLRDEVLLTCTEHGNRDRGDEDGGLNNCTPFPAWHRCEELCYRNWMFGDGALGPSTSLVPSFSIPFTPFGFELGSDVSPGQVEYLGYNGYCEARRSAALTTCSDIHSQCSTSWTNVCQGR